VREAAQLRRDSSPLLHTPKTLKPRRTWETLQTLKTSAGIPESRSLGEAASASRNCKSSVWWARRSRPAIWEPPWKLRGAGEVLGGRYRVRILLKLLNC
jgi:hypothetical protein